MYRKFFNENTFPDSVSGDRYSYSFLTLSSLLFLWTESKKGKRWGCNSSACSVCYSATRLTFHLLSFSSKSFGPLPPPPPPIQNVSVGMRIVVVVVVVAVFFLFCFVSRLSSADWLLITPPCLMRGNDSVFFSPQLKHYRQTHSFIIWGGAAFLSSFTCRDSVFCNAAMPLKRCFAIFWDRRSHRYQKDFGISSATVGNMINFYSNKRQIGVSYRLYFSTLLVVQVYLWAVFDYDDYTQYFYALCHGFCLYLS